MNDEAGQAYPATVDTLLDNALGPRATTARSARTSTPTTRLRTSTRGDRRLGAGARCAPDLVQAAARLDGRAQQLVDPRLSWSAGTLTFETTIAAGANGLETLLPTQGPSGTLTSLTCGGSPRPYSVSTIKGIQYAVFTPWPAAAPRRIPRPSTRRARPAATTRALRPGARPRWTSLRSPVLGMPPVMRSSDRGCEQVVRIVTSLTPSKNSSTLPRFRVRRRVLPSS